MYATYVACALFIEYYIVLVVYTTSILKNKGLNLAWEVKQRFDKDFRINY
jgi:hypothetical protein